MGVSDSCWEWWRNDGRKVAFSTKRKRKERQNLHAECCMIVAMQWWVLWFLSVVMDHWRRKLWLFTRSVCSFFEFSVEVACNSTHLLCDWSDSTSIDSHSALERCSGGISATEGAVWSSVRLRVPPERFTVDTLENRHRIMSHFIVIWYMKYKAEKRW